MLKTEKSFWLFVQKHLAVIVAAAGTMLSLCIRYVLRDELSWDMKVFLLPWYWLTKAYGGIHALNTCIGNYGMLYQTIVALFTYIPVEPIYLYKLLSIVFDYLLGLGIGYLVYILCGRNFMKAVIAYLLTVNLPTVFLNSAFWGQCDSIFTFFCVASLIFLLKDKNIPAFLSFGAAFSFKLQAVFLLPFLLFLYVYRKKYSLLHFLIVPAVMVVLSLGGLLQGRHISEIVTIYTTQTDVYKIISSSYPGFWQTMVPVNSEAHYDTIKAAAVCLTVVVLLIQMAVVFASKRKLGPPVMLQFAFLLTYTCVYFLPSMHERYSYLYVALALFTVFTDWKMIPALVSIQIIDVLTYSPFLFGYEHDWTMLVLLNTATYLYCCIRFYKTVFSAEKEEPALPAPEVLSVNT